MGFRQQIFAFQLFERQIAFSALFAPLRFRFLRVQLDAQNVLKDCPTQVEDCVHFFFCFLQNNFLAKFIWFLANFKLK